MVLLRIILLILVIYLILRMLGRLFFGNLSARRSTGGSSGKGYNRRKEGDVYVKENPDRKEKLIREDDGEYVKFEEVDDD